MVCFMIEYYNRIRIEKFIYIVYIYYTYIIHIYIYIYMNIKLLELIECDMYIIIK